MYIGQEPATSFTGLIKQDFSVSATTSYTLSHSVNNANDIALYINFVRQEPTTSYSCSGTSLTLSQATVSGDDMYCIFLGQALQTVNPSLNSVGISQLNVSDGTSGQALTTNGSGGLSFASVGGANTPSWSVNLNASQTITNVTYTKIQFDRESVDTNNSYDNSTNYRWTCPSGQAGKYFIFSNLFLDSDGTGQFEYGWLQFRKNGSAFADSFIDCRDNNGTKFTVSHSFINDVAVGDYYEVFAYISDTSGNPRVMGGGAGSNDEATSNFGGFKIIE